MNKEVLKQFAEICKSFKEEKAMSISLDGAIHVGLNYLLKHYPDELLHFNKRNCDTFPFKISVMDEGIKLYALATTQEAGRIPQFKKQIKDEIQKQLNELNEQYQTFLQEDVVLDGMGGVDHAV